MEYRPAPRLERRFPGPNSADGTSGRPLCKESYPPKISNRINIFSFTCHRRNMPNSSALPPRGGAHAHLQICGVAEVQRPMLHWIERRAGCVTKARRAMLH